MKYSLEDLIDIKKFQRLMKEFYYITEIPHGLIDAEGNILSGIGWQDVCIKFHRMNPRSAFRCKESDLTVSNTLDSNKKFELYRCKNGLMEAAVPIVVENKYMGILGLGQFLFQEPDITFFRKQAEEFGYDIDRYIEAVKRIPIFTREKVQASMDYFFHLAEMLSNMGLNSLKQKETENLLLKANEELEEKVSERTAKLAIVNKQLKKDIKERKIIQRKLEESEERYKKLIEIIPDSIVVHDKGKIYFVNPAFAQAVGIENCEELIGRKIFEFIHPHDHILLECCTNYITKGNILPLTEKRLIDVEGNLIDIEATGRLFNYKGEKAVLTIARDISERKRIKKLQKKIKEEQRLLKESKEYEKLKKEFFANLSHEFRTPLNIIYGSIQLLEHDLKDILKIKKCRSINKRIKVLKRNTYRLLRLYNNLLDITRIDSGYFELELKNCNIVSLVENITMSVAEYTKSNNIKVLFDTDKEENIIAVDCRAIERIMLNLLSNAVKFSKSGGEIFVKLYSTDKDVFISVKDTGIGIPEDKQQIIFNPFRQVNKSLTRDHEGSGIGLSLVEALVNLHNGEIKVNSEYKQSSEFIIRFPVTQIKNGERVDIDYDMNDNNRNNINLIDIEFSDIYLLNRLIK